MEILIALFLIIAIPFSACFYCLICCWPRVRKAMDTVDQESEKEDERFRLHLFCYHLSWQQIFLFIYRNNEVVYRKEDYIEEQLLSPEEELSPKVVYYSKDKVSNKDKEVSLGRESFLTNHETRKNSDISLLQYEDDYSFTGSPDSSFTPIRPIDPQLESFIRDMHQGFEDEKEEVVIISHPILC